jgi:acetyl esterase/lipase
MHETVNNWGGVEGTYQPELLVYLPDPAHATGTAVMICPGGGGYSVLAIRHEGRQVGEYLQSIGVAGIICKYRLREPQEALEPATTRVLGDAERGMRLIRSHAAQWSIDPDRVGIIGFSKGGLTVLNLVTHADAANSKADDAVDRLSSRPNFMILAYPSVSKELLGNLNEHAPPALLVSAADDTTGWSNSIDVFETLDRNNVAAELHVFATGEHGFGIGQPTTPALWQVVLKSWLLNKVFLTTSTRPSGN